MQWIGTVCLYSVLSGWEQGIRTRHTGFEQKRAGSNPDGVWIRVLVTAEVDGALWHISLEIDGDV